MDHLVGKETDVYNENVDVLQSPDLLPLAMVMLFDLQDRRFLLRERSTMEGEEPLQEVRDLESSLHRCVCRCQVLTCILEFIKYKCYTCVFIAGVKPS